MGFGGIVIFDLWPTCHLKPLEKNTTLHAFDIIQSSDLFITDSKKDKHTKSKSQNIMDGSLPSYIPVDIVNTIKILCSVNWFSNIYRDHGYHIPLKINNVCIYTYKHIQV